MSILKHTSGEWIFCNWVKILNGGDAPTEIVGSGLPHGRLIATLNFDSIDPELTAEKVLANAKLFKAAPAMFDLLSKMSEATIVDWRADAKALIEQITK